MRRKLLEWIFSDKGPLSRKWTSVILVCLALLLVSVSIDSGLQYDDYAIRDRIRQFHLWLNTYQPFIELFRFLNGSPGDILGGMQIGRFPWWTYEELRLAFFRPIAAVTHWLDYRLWPENPAFMHLHSLLWFGLLVFLVALIYRRIMTPVWIAGLAALLYAIDDAHGIPAGWLANRSALMAAVFGFSAIIFHDSWRRKGWTAGAILAPLCFILGLLSAEFGLGAGAYLLAYEVCLVSGNWRRKAIGILPYALIGIIWWTLYQTFGFGTSGSGAYIDPGPNPLAYFYVLVERVPVLLFGQWFFPDALFYGFLLKPLTYLFLACLYVLLTGIVIVLIPLLKRDAVSRFWALGMVLSLLPICATFPWNRLLLFVGLGGMGLLAQFLASWFQRAEWLPGVRWWRTMARIFVVVFVLVHFITAPLSLPLQSRYMARMRENLLEKPLLALSKKEEIGGKTLIFLNPPIPFAIAHIPFICEEYGLSFPFRIRILASGMTQLNIRRIDSFSLEIEPEDGFIIHSFDRIYRGSTHPMAVGQRVSLSDMNVEVLKLTKDQRPLRVRFRFSRSLNDPAISFYEWKNDRFVPLILPETGEAVSLDRVSLNL